MTPLRFASLNNLLTIYSLVTSATWKGICRLCLVSVCDCERIGMFVCSSVPSFRRCTVSHNLLDHVPACTVHVMYVRVRIDVHVHVRLVALLVVHQQLEKFDLKFPFFHEKFILEKVLQYPQIFLVQNLRTNWQNSQVFSV